MARNRLETIDDEPAPRGRAAALLAAASKAAAPVAPVEQPRLTLEQLVAKNVIGRDAYNPLFQQLGAPDWQTQPGGSDESGNPILFDQPNQDAAKLANDYTFGWNDTGYGNTGTLTAYDPAGAQVGAYQQQDQSSLQSLGEWAALAAAGFGGVGLLGLGPLGGVLGGAGAAGTAASTAAGADIGALGLAEGVYGAGGALGAGVAPGTVGGLAGSTAGFGGLGSVLPAGVGYGGAAAAGGALGAGLLEQLTAPNLGGGLGVADTGLGAIGADATAFGGLPELGGLASGAPVETAFGAFGLPAAPAVSAGGGLLNMPPLEAPNLGGGLGVSTPELGAIGADATAFGGLPELNALAAGAPMETAFGTFALPAAATEAAPAIFNAAKDSQLASQQLGITGAQSAAAATAPATVNLGSLGGTTGTAGGLQGLLAEVKQGIGGGLLGDAASWMKANPLLGRLLTSGATTLLSGAGGGGGGGGGAQQPVGPPVQWTSPLQQGLLSPVKQYAPAAIQQNRPAGLLAQGYQNDGAWRYLGG